MARTTNTVEQVGRQAGQMAAGAVRGPWVERLARLGYAARGVVYAIVGILAVQAAFGGGSEGRTTGSEGAVVTVARQSTALLWLLALGLLGYAIWRLIQGALDAEGKGTDPKGLVKRGAMIASGIAYGALALFAVRIATGSGGGGGQSGDQGWTADLMTKPFGRWLVGLAGLAVIASGLYQIARGWSEKFREHLKLGEMSAEEQRLALHTGKLGLIARGIVFLLSGWFLIQAALRFDPSQARGLGGALETLASQPYGPWLLGLVALGLIAFGAYSILEARYRRINA
jgi:hypothetical protein